MSPQVDELLRKKSRKDWAKGLLAAPRAPIGDNKNLLLKFVFELFVGVFACLID
jgi:hypothetical protein